MANIVFLSVPARGHLNPVLPIIAELMRRGHRVGGLHRPWPTFDRQRDWEFASEGDGARLTLSCHRDLLPTPDSVVTGRLTKRLKCRLTGSPYNRAIPSTPSRPDPKMLKTFALSALFFLTLGVMFAAYASVPFGA